MAEKVINIMNFVRGIEPRNPHKDLTETICNELKLCREYGFENTVLLQYDAMQNPGIMQAVKAEATEKTEFGLWFEMCRQLVEKVGIEWRGREGYDWDWYVNPGFLMAYTPSQREDIIDEVMREFSEQFGYFPRSVGSWLIDSHSMSYMAEKYGIKAFGICREQYSTDAYTLWGGYLNQPYYPSKNNVLCPAQTPECQINAPVFRLLGIDPIYGYDWRYNNPRLSVGSCYTMEAYWDCAHDEKIVDWYYDTYYNQECLNFAYSQIGQENGFDWSRVKTGLDIQFEKLAKLQKEGRVQVKTMGDIGELYMKNFKSTASTSLIAAEDWSGNGTKSLWYNCKNYRANLYLWKERLGFRDIHKFDENYKERYLSGPCENWEAIYDNLPVVEGRMWNIGNQESGLFFERALKDMKWEKCGEGLRITAEFHNETVVIELCEDKIAVEGNVPLRFFGNPACGNETAVEMEICENSLRMKHKDFSYEVFVSGKLEKVADGYRILPENNRIEVIL